MVTIGMNYDVLPGKEEVFVRAFEGVLSAIEKAPGHTRSFLYEKVNGKGSYLILSEWEDQGAFQEFVRSEAFARVTNWGKEQILRGRPTHTVYQGN